MALSQQNLEVLKPKVKEYEERINKKTKYLDKINTNLRARIVLQWQALSIIEESIGWQFISHSDSLEPLSKQQGKQ